jgi:hypothetical protein
VCAGPCHEALAALLAEAEDACGAAGRAVLQWRATGTLPQRTAPMAATTAGAAAGWEWDGATAVPSFRARLFEGPPSLAAFDHFPAAFDLDRHLRALLAAVANARLAERLVCTRNYYGRTCDDVASGLAAAAAAACAPLRSEWAFDSPALGAPAYELSPMTTLAATANQCVSLPYGARNTPRPFLPPPRSRKRAVRGAERVAARCLECNGPLTELVPPFLPLSPHASPYSSLTHPVTWQVREGHCCTPLIAGWCLVARPALSPASPALHGIHTAAIQPPLSQLYSTAFLSLNCFTLAEAKAEWMDLVLSRGPPAPLEPALLARVTGVPASPSAAAAALPLARAETRCDDTLEPRAVEPSCAAGRCGARFWGEACCPALRCSSGAASRPYSGACACTCKAGWTGLDCGARRHHLAVSLRLARASVSGFDPYDFRLTIARQAPPPPPLVLSGHAASLTRY